MGDAGRQSERQDDEAEAAELEAENLEPGDLAATDLAATDLADSVIGRALRSHFAALLAEPVPARFLVMLAELEAKEARRASSAGRDDGSAVPGDPPPDQST